MADTPDDLPPIGTAQNAADVARKAELEAANRSEIVQRIAAQNAYHAFRHGIIRHAASQGDLPWTDDQVADAWNLMSRDPSKDEFLEALRFLVTKTLEA